MQNPSNEELSERAKNGFMFYMMPTIVMEDDRLDDGEKFLCIIYRGLKTPLASTPEPFAGQRQRHPERHHRAHHQHQPMAQGVFRPAVHEQRAHQFYRR